MIFEDKPKAPRPIDDDFFGKRYRKPESEESKESEQKENDGWIDIKESIESIESIEDANKECKEIPRPWGERNGQGVRHTIKEPETTMRKKLVHLDYIAPDLDEEIDKLLYCNDLLAKALEFSSELIKEHYKDKLAVLAAVTIALFHEDLED